MNRQNNNFYHHKFRILIFKILICIAVCVLSLCIFRTSSQTFASASPADPNRLSRPSGDANTQRGSKPSTLPADPSVSTVTQAAVKLGVLSSVSRINQVATFLTKGNQSGVFLFPPQQPPDQHVFSTSFELIRQDESAEATLYASASFFPNLDAVYDTVEFVNKSCDELEKTVFKSLKRVGVIKKNIVFFDAGNVKVFLMPAGSGCVVIKKEVVK